MWCCRIFPFHGRNSIRAVVSGMGENIDQGQILTYYTEQIWVSHQGYVQSEYGILGQVHAYIGLVETQGQETLHLHMLLWLNQHGVLQCKQNAPWPINNDDMVEADGTWNPRHDIAFLNVWNPALLHNG